MVLVNDHLEKKQSFSDTDNVCGTYIVKHYLFENLNVHGLWSDIMFCNLNPYMSRHRHATSSPRLERSLFAGKRLDKFNWQRKYDGRILLRRYLGERLKVAQLERRRRLADHVRRLLERLGRQMFSLGGDHLQYQANWSQMDRWIAPKVSNMLILSDLYE